MTSPRVISCVAIVGIATATDGAALPSDAKRKSWLVTDFVTVGAALTHAHFLMCVGKTQADLQDDFTRRVREREFPTCPPQQSAC